MEKSATTRKKLGHKIMPSDELQFSKGVFKILNDKGKINGTGFMVTSSAIITCAHVISSISSKDPNFPWQVAVKVQHTSANISLNSLIIKEHWRDPHEGDFAVLQLEQPISDTIILPLISSQNSGSLEFRSLGFPAYKSTNGVLARGKVLGRIPSNEISLYQLESTQVTTGFSGGPVWVEELNGVIGMISAILPPDQYGRQSETAYALPSQTIFEFCPFLDPGNKFSSDYSYAHTSDPVQRDILHFLIEAAQKYNSDYLGMETIQKKINIPVKALIQHLSQLELDGLVIHLTKPINQRIFHFYKLNKKD